MARPQKDGVDYWPLDIDFLTCDEIRLIRTQFGAKGVLIAIGLINECYKSAGYFKHWDDDCCLLMADALSCGITPDLISQVVSECIKRGLFNEDVFSGFSVLTSAGIQRRFLRMINNRDETEIIEEYWLLDLTSKKDVPASILNKLTFKNHKSNFNGVKSNSKGQKPSDNPQSKEKKSKAKERKENQSKADASVDSSFDSPSEDYGLTEDDMRLMAEEATRLNLQISEIEGMVTALGMPFAKADYELANGYIAQYGFDVVKEAVRRTAVGSTSGRAWRYIEGIMRNVQKEGDDTRAGRPNNRKNDAAAQGGENRRSDGNSSLKETVITL